MRHEVNAVMLSFTNCEQDALHAYVVDVRLLRVLLICYPKGYAAPSSVQYQGNM